MLSKSDKTRVFLTRRIEESCYRNSYDPNRRRRAESESVKFDERGRLVIGGELTGFRRYVY